MLCLGREGYKSKCWRAVNNQVVEVKYRVAPPEVEG